MEESSKSLKHRIADYYASRFPDPDDETERKGSYDSGGRWGQESSALKGWMNHFVGGLDLPFKSIAIFAGCWMLLEIGWPLLILLGVVTAGTVWSVPTTIPCMYIAVYAMIMTSGMNMVRSIIMQLGSRRDNLVKALFRGYFWSLLSIGAILIIHEYFHATMPGLFLIPILYFIPIEILGNTAPIPILLGLSGWYMDIAVTVIVYAIGVTGSSIGGFELLQYFLENSQHRGTYGAILGVLLLAVFPAVNIYFSLTFLETIMDLFGRCVSLGI